MQALRGQFQQRAKELCDDVMDGPLNNKGLPDFVERRLIESMLFTVFSIVVMTLLPAKEPKQS